MLQAQAPVHAAGAPAAAQRRLHVAVYSGQYIRADAISQSARRKVRMLRALQAAGLPLRTTVFTQRAETYDPAVLLLYDVHELWLRPEFHDADVHLFEFGIRYALFNAVFLIPPERTVLAVYHNVTPPELAFGDQRRVQEQSLLQMHNLWRADRIACVSEFNRNDLLAIGIPPERLSVLHLPPTVRAVPQPRRGATVELLFVGRFVPAKGAPDLAEAVLRLHRKGVRGFRVTMVGNRGASSAGCIAAISRAIDDHGLHDVLRLVLTPDDAELARLYGSSDALVIPSYHEGYCLPVVEAMAAGCYVIAYDAGNLPFIVGGLGSLVPTGDVDALAAAMEEHILMVERSRAQRLPMQLRAGGSLMPEAEWRRAVARRLEDHSDESYARGFLELLRWAAARSPQTAHVAAELGLDALDTMQRALA